MFFNINVASKSVCYLRMFVFNKTFSQCYDQGYLKLPVIVIIVTAQACDWLTNVVYCRIDLFMSRFIYGVNMVMLRYLISSPANGWYLRWNRLAEVACLCYDIHISDVCRGIDLLMLSIYVTISMDDGRTDLIYCLW